MPESLPQAAQGSDRGSGMDDPHQDDGRPWLTLSEAAKASGVHIDALRARVKRRQLPARKGNLGQWLVQLPQAAPGAALGSPGHDSGDDSGSAQGSLSLAPGDALAVPEAVAELRAEVAELRLALARAEARAEMAEALGKAEADKARAVAAETVNAQDILIGELKLLLAEARRPWWQKLFGRSG